MYHWKQNNLLLKNSLRSKTIKQKQKNHTNVYITYCSYNSQSAKYFKDYPTYLRAENNQKHLQPAH